MNRGERRKALERVEAVSVEREIARARRCYSIGSMLRAALGPVEGRAFLEEVHRAEREACGDDPEVRAYVADSHEMEMAGLGGCARPYRRDI